MIQSVPPHFMQPFTMHTCDVIYKTCTLWLIMGSLQKSASLTSQNIPMPGRAQLLIQKKVAASQPCAVYLQHEQANIEPTVQDGKPKTMASSKCEWC